MLHVPDGHSSVPEELRTGRAAALPHPAGEVVKEQGKRRFTAVYVSRARDLVAEGSRFSRPGIVAERRPERNIAENP